MSRTYFGKKKFFYGENSKKKSSGFKQRICHKTHGLVSRIRKLTLFAEDEEMAYFRSDVWRSCDDESLCDEDSKSSFSDCKSSCFSDYKYSHSSDSSINTLNDSCFWEIHSPDSGFYDGGCDDSQMIEKLEFQILHPAKFILPDSPRNMIASPTIKLSPIKKKSFSQKKKMDFTIKYSTPKFSSKKPVDRKNGKQTKLHKELNSKTKNIMKNSKITDYFSVGKPSLSLSLKNEIRKHNSAVESSNSVLFTPSKRNKVSQRKCVTDPVKKRKLDKSPLKKLSCERPSIKKVKSDQIFPLLDENSVSSSSFFGTIFGSNHSLHDTDLGVSPIKMVKECVSCGTNRTPLWRDADGNTPLCNACGIRWKKYRVRCTRCWYVPMKEESVPYCSNCGNFNTIKKHNSMRRHKSCIY